MSNPWDSAGGGAATVAEWDFPAGSGYAASGSRDSAELPHHQEAEGKLNPTPEQVEHGHHIFRAYFKHAFVKQYEKFSTFLRNQICSNNLSDFRLKKGLEHLAAGRERFLAITDRFATFQAPCLNAHVEFPLCSLWRCRLRLAPPNFPASRFTIRA